MSLQIVEPRIRGFVGLSAHPAGCDAEVRRQVARVETAESAGQSGEGLLVVGASTGYGLASRIAGAFGHGLPSVGVFYERPATDRRTASAGWYNTAAFHAEAQARGLAAYHVNGDAFSDEVLDETLRTVRDKLGRIGVVAYSVAAPRRRDPASGHVYESVLKTVGQPFHVKTIDLKSEEVREATIEPAAPEEIAGTVATMGGTDLERWVTALAEANALADGAKVVAYSYIGPEVTWPIYKDGTIGQAKADLERTARRLDERLRAQLGGRCLVSVNKSVVTQASAAIPGVPLYMSLLFGVMKAAGTHEGPIGQMRRLFADYLAQGQSPATDSEGRIRLDDLEMDPNVQAEAFRRWEQVDSGNLRTVADFDGFTCYFHRLFGFRRPEVDYTQPVETGVDIPGVRDLAA